jgi:hypothetical protein
MWLGPLAGLSIGLSLPRDGSFPTHKVYAVQTQLTRIRKRFRLTTDPQAQEHQIRRGDSDTLTCEYACIQRP